MTDSETKRSPRIRNLIAFSTFIMLLFCLIVAYQASRSYQSTLEMTKANAYRLMRIMSQQIELTFMGVDNTLHRAVERQYYNDLFGGNLPDYMLHNLQMWVDESPRVIAMIMVDDQGMPTLAAHKKDYAHWMDYTHSFQDEPLFKQIREGSDAELFIGKLTQSDNRKQDLILMGRKITRVDGGFGGVFIAALDPEFFIDYFRSVDQGRYSSLSLQILGSGLVLADSKSGDASNAEINKRVVQQLQKKPASTFGVDTYRAQNSLKIHAFQSLKSLPLVVNVALDEQDYLKGWRAECLKDIGFLAIFMAFGSVLSFFALTMARQIVRVEESEAAAVLASQAKSEFLANMSHELRTPLNAIIGFSEMMNSGYFGPMNPRQKERVHDINLCGNHLLHLITDILEFSKGDAGKLELVEEDVAMEDIVDETVRMMNEKIKAKRMNMLQEVEPELPRLLGDKRKIRQILINLLSNALKFTPEDGTIRVVLRRDNHHNITLTVTDTGIGISEEDIPVALSVFGQVHRSQSHEGTGLGLPLCKMFAELHGGKLTLASTFGEGTTVRVLFPASRNIAPKDNKIRVA